VLDYDNEMKTVIRDGEATSAANIQDIILHLNREYTRDRDECN